ncbi:type IV pilus modification PilV family protein [Angustibacter sp. McL0619]|uniref:type IV pilus modification PilV family protein n=1 Tax=Angustibacter sp. McL0619 TaxID=3415676 RepID=UPI003CF196AB
MLSSVGIARVRRRLDRVNDDSGFSMIEAIVAFGVLSVFAIALGVTLVNAMGVSKSARERVAAANLAAREIEIVRNKFATSDTDAMAVANAGTVTNGSPLAGSSNVVDGVSYTVRREVQWMPIGNGASACDGGSLVSYPSLRVSVEVSWPNMGSTKPVVSQSMLTPPKGTLDDVTLSYVAVKVTNAAGGPSDGVLLTIAGPGGTFNQSTDASGCAVVQVGSAGTYSATADMAGWVDQTGVQRSVLTPITVSAGAMQRVAMTYDVAATLDVTVSNIDPATYRMPATIGQISYTQPNVPAIGSQRVLPLTGGTATMTGLWPTTSGYSPWGGGCSDSDPAATTGVSRITPVVVPPGARRAAVAKLAAVKVTTMVGSTVTGGARVTATSITCPSQPVLDLGTSDSVTGLLLTSVPYGQYRLDAVWPAPINKSVTKTPWNATSTVPTTVLLKAS